MTEAIQARPDTTLFAGSTDFDTAQRMAQALAASTMVPDLYKNSVPNVLIAMEVANRLGASVFSVMQGLNVIKGKPGWTGSHLIAMANSSGKFSPLRFKKVGEQGKDSYGFYCIAKSKIDGEVCVGTTIDWKMVKAEGWDRNPKWKSMTDQMFTYRSAAFWVRAYCPEIALGMHTTAEEFQDFDPIIQARAVDMPAELAPGDTSELEQQLRASVDANNAAKDAALQSSLELEAPAGIEDVDPEAGEVLEGGE